MVHTPRMTFVRLLRARRPRIAWLTLVLLLSQQISLTAYACPVPEALPAAAQSVPAMVDCEEMEMPDPSAPALCDQHCESDHVATPDLKPLQLPAMTLHLVHVALVEPPQPSIGSGYDGNIPLARSDPPLTLRFCSLLI